MKLIGKQVITTLMILGSTMKFAMASSSSDNELRQIFFPRHRTSGNQRHQSPRPARKLRGSSSSSSVPNSKHPESSTHGQDGILHEAHHANHANNTTRHRDRDLLGSSNEAGFDVKIRNLGNSAYEYILVFPKSAQTKDLFLEHVDIAQYTSLVASEPNTYQYQLCPGASCGNMTLRMDRQPGIGCTIGGVYYLRLVSTNAAGTRHIHATSYNHWKTGEDKHIDHECPTQI